MTDASDIINGLGGSTHTGMCRCPAHDDKTPSLHVSTGRNGQVVFYCHAKCSQAEVIAALQARGLWKQEPERKRSKGPPGYYEDDEEMAAQQLNRPASSWVNASFEAFSPTATGENDAKNSASLTDEERYQKFVWARAILHAAVSSAKPAEHAERLAPYLKQRGISIPPPPSLMYLPLDQSRALARHIPGFLAYPAIVAPLVDQGHLKGVLVTFLTHDGTSNLRSVKTGKNIRKIYGTTGYVGLGVIDPEQPPDTLVIGEGIETALAASQLTGTPALAVPGGNFIGITPPPCTHLVIAADNDASGSGMKKAKAAAQWWTKTGHLVQIAAPANHKDWADALRDPQSDHHKLGELILNDQPVQPDMTGNVGAVSAEEFMAMSFPPRDFLLEPWLTAGSLAMVHAFRGTGKTWLALSIGNAIATGKDLLGWRARKSARVLYVDGELPGDLLQKRLNGFGPCPANLYILSQHFLHVHGKQLPDLGTEEGRKFLDQIIEQNQIDVIILDSISTLVRSGVENDAESWTPLVSWQLQHRFRGRAVIYLHHEGRGGNPRGTSKREDAFDSMIRLEAGQSSEHETAFKLSFTKNRDFFGADAMPKLIFLSISDGLVHWHTEAAQPDNREQIKELLRDGVPQSEIAKRLNISKSWVSRVAGMVRNSGRDSHVMGVS